MERNKTPTKNIPEQEKGDDPIFLPNEESNYLLQMISWFKCKEKTSFVKTC